MSIVKDILDVVRWEVAGVVSPSIHRFMLDELLDECVYWEEVFQGDHCFPILCPVLELGAIDELLAMASRGLSFMFLSGI